MLQLKKMLDRQRKRHARANECRLNCGSRLQCLMPGLELALPSSFPSSAYQSFQFRLDSFWEKVVSQAKHEDLLFSLACPSKSSLLYSSESKGIAPKFIIPICIAWEESWQSNGVDKPWSLHWELVAQSQGSTALTHGTSSLETVYNGCYLLRANGAFVKVPP